jgi:hypothetical protein
MRWRSGRHDPATPTWRAGRSTTDMNTAELNTTRAESLSSTRSDATESTRRDADDSTSVDFPEPTTSRSTAPSWTSRARTARSAARAHLHGVMAHLTAVGVEMISIAPVAQFNQPPTTTHTRPERNETS